MGGPTAAMEEVTTTRLMLASRLLVLLQLEVPVATTTSNNPWQNCVVDSDKH